MSGEAARRRRRWIVAAAAIQLALFAALLAWRTAQWERRGWAGVAFAGNLELLPDAPLSGLLGDVRGAVLIVAPDSPATRAGLAVGDVVVSVDGVGTGDVTGLRRLAEGKRRGDRLVYEVRGERGRRRIDVSLESPLSRLDTVLGMASSFLVGTAFLAISLLVYRARPRSRSAFVFYLLCSLGAALFFLSSASELDLPDLRGIVPLATQPHLWVLFAVYTLLSLALTNLLLHLSLIFPRPRPIALSRPVVFAWLHTLPFLPFAALTAAAAALAAARETAGLWALEITAAAAAAALLLRLARGRRDHLRETLLAHPMTCQLLLLAAVAAAAPAARLVPQPAAAAAVLLAYLGLVGFLFLVLTAYSLWTFAAFARSYRESGEVARRQLRWPLWGSIVALAGVTLLIPLSLAFSLSQTPDAAILPWVNALPRLLYLLIPVSLAFGILEYRLTEIDALVRKTVVYAGVTAFVIAGYLVLAGGLGIVLVTWAGVDNRVVTAVSTLAIAALLVPVKNRIQAFVDRRFARAAEHRAAETAQPPEASLPPI